MNASLIAMRYANALFQLGKVDELVLDSIYIDCSYLKGVMKESQDLDQFLRNALIKPGKKIQVFHGIFEKQLHVYTLKFIDLVINNNREVLLSSILLNFIEMYRRFKGIKTVTVITAVPIDDKMHQAICESIGRQFSCLAELECRVDPDIIGGLVLMMDGKMVDGSITGQLRSMKKKLLTN
ncbi:ATP synthase F1 subunit delta [Alkaliflexus imshenetskii]|uniref:ATP synthase F1 subunit delta n=1 Tax=Alkaliflexus imshenetskii TaxID=286730 RepID=UPI0004B6EABD|nr:ATP synthase F1 subunit delta [Alkaliflexus imshenetskii]